MFEVKKGEFKTTTKVEYPMTICWVSRLITINGKTRWATGEGIATCMSEDNFDKRFGEELSRIKAEINYLKDEERILIQLTKQPEWRKEKPKEEYIIEPDNNHFVTNHVNIFNNRIDNKKVKVTVEVL